MSCFWLVCVATDVIFFIFLYQRYIYRVDHTRVNEFGVSGEDLGVGVEGAAAIEGTSQQDSSEPAAEDEPATEEEPTAEGETEDNAEQAGESTDSFATGEALEVEDSTPEAERGSTVRHRQVPVSDSSWCPSCELVYILWTSWFPMVIIMKFF